MIKININNKQEFAKYFYKKIENFINQTNTKYFLDDINRDLIHIFDKDLEEIVTAEPKELRKLISIAPNNFPDTILELKDLYYVFRNKFGVEFLERLEINVCPYCNREYIFKFEDTKKKESRILASLDHYYDKDTYPFLAISLFNLIPSCHICNSKFKHTKNFYDIQHIHPFEDNFNSMAKFHFKLVTNKKKKEKIFSNNSIYLELKPLKNFQKIENTITTFRLNIYIKITKT